jgi:hypothetical protein
MNKGLTQRFQSVEEIKDTVDDIFNEGVPGWEELKNEHGIEKHGSISNIDLEKLLYEILPDEAESIKAHLLKVDKKLEEEYNEKG